MELETVKLVAFALWAEAYEGTTGKAPATLRSQFECMQEAESLDDLRNGLGEDLAFKLDNYLTVWELPVEAAPAPTEREQVEAIEQMEEPGEALARSMTPAEIEAAELTRYEAARELREIGHTEATINAKLGPPAKEKPKPRKKRK